MITVAVTGGRHYSNRQRVFEALDALFAARPFDRLVQGGATGADALAAEWARACEVTLETEPADWASYGKSAGPRRNRRMLDVWEVDILVAFAGNVGTRDCIAAAEERKIRVLHIKD